MMAMLLKKCLTSTCYVTIVFDPAEFDDVFTETDWSLCLYRQLGPAGDFVWARSAVPSRDGSKQLTEPHGSDDKAMTEDD